MLKNIVLFLVLVMTIINSLDKNDKGLKCTINAILFMLSGICISLHLLGYIKLNNYIYIELGLCLIKLISEFHFINHEQGEGGYDMVFHHIVFLLSVIAIFTIGKEYKYLFPYCNYIHLALAFSWLSKCFEKDTMIQLCCYKLYLILWLITSFLRIGVCLKACIKCKRSVCFYSLIFLTISLASLDYLWTPKFHKYQNILN